MRGALRAREGGGIGGPWSHWLRVACVALFGFWQVLHSVSTLAQALPIPLQEFAGTNGTSVVWFTDFIAAASSNCGAQGRNLVPPVRDTSPPSEVYGWDCADGEGVIHPSSAAVRYSCESGWSVTSDKLACVNNACSTIGGVKKPFQVVTNDGGNCSARPDHVCFADGCRGATVSGGDCIGLPLAQPPQSMWTGFAQVITSTQCGPNDPAAVSSSNNATTVSAGGAGVASSLPSGADSINLARIATNTARIAEGVVGGGSSSSGCGGVAQPPCKLDESGVEAAGQEAASAQAAAETSMASALDAQASGLSLGAMPDFTGGSSSTRWTLTFLPFLAASGPAECKVQWDVPLVGHVFKAGYDFCGLADSLKQFLYWAFAVGTAFSMWNMVYRTRGGE